MKGIIFTELLELMNEKIGLIETETLVASCDFESKCAYTSVGNYPVEELLVLVTKFSEVTGESIEAVIFLFAEFMFEKFEQGFPQFSARPTCSISWKRSSHLSTQKFASFTPMRNSHDS